MVVNYGITSRHRTTRAVEGSGAIGTRKRIKKAT